MSQKKRSTPSRELILDSGWIEVQSCHESFHESSAHVGGCSLAVNGGPALSRVMLINAHHTPPTQELAQGAHKIVPYIEVEMFLGFYFHKKGINLQGDNEAVGGLSQLSPLCRSGNISRSGSLSTSHPQKPYFPSPPICRISFK